MQLWNPDEDWTEKVRTTPHEFSDSDVLLGSTIAFLAVFAGIAFIKPELPDWSFLVGGIALGVLIVRLRRAANEVPGSMRVFVLAVLLAMTLAGITAPVMLDVLPPR